MKLLTSLLVSLTFVFSFNHVVKAGYSSSEFVAVAYPDTDSPSVEQLDGKLYYFYPDYTFKMGLNGESIPQQDWFSEYDGYDAIIIFNVPVGSIYVSDHLDDIVINDISYLYIDSYQNKINFYNIYDELIAQHDGPYLEPFGIYIPYIDDEAETAIYTRGYDDGHNDGFKQGKSAGYDIGFDEGFQQGDAQGFSRGHEKGLNEGTSAWGVLFSAMMSTFSGFLAIEIFPELTIGMIISVPLILGLLAFIIGVAKGGKND